MRHSFVTPLPVNLFVQLRIHDFLCRPMGPVRIVTLGRWAGLALDVTAGASVQPSFLLSWIIREERYFHKTTVDLFSIAAEPFLPGPL